MIIKKVRISNFFCYVSENVFNFEEGLNIVSAKNSAGKSHLFNAFHWTFFNQIYVDTTKDTTKKEWKSADKVIVLPDYVISNAEVDANLKTVIDITLSAEYHKSQEGNTNELIEYRFIKEMLFRKGTDDVFPIDKPNLDISYVKDGETIYLEKGEHKWFLDKLFPVSIRKFMWFQGETVDELYDFSNPNTLNYAIKEISYFPIYENLVEITKQSVSSINKKIDTEFKKKRKLTKDQKQLLDDIDLKTTRSSSYGGRIVDMKNELSDLIDLIFKEEEKLKGYGKYSDLQRKMTKLDYEIKTCNDKIESLGVYGKEQFISKWMLHKCDNLINASVDNLNLLSEEIKSFQKSENPVPITLPGPEYVQQMLDNHVCYICERSVEENTPAYAALELRMEDFKNNQAQKILSDNYTELNRFKRNLIAELPLIAEEAKTNDDDIEKLISKRKKKLAEIANLLSESGVEKVTEITRNSSTAEQILNKIRSLSSSKTDLEKRIIRYESDKKTLDDDIEALSAQKAKDIFLGDEDETAESTAEKYISLINSVLANLKNAALEKLMDEINIESNILYSKYLGGNNQGEIRIDQGVRVIDKLTKKSLSNLNTAELTAQKLAVANAFLSLSEKKMNRSFPLLADAPTSQFDDDNTLSLTENLTDSFKQIIVMSKDYNSLKGDDRLKYISKAKIIKYYELKNDLIDKDGPASRTNRKTYIKTIK
ncbi:AAA family ATPase [uncultured Arcticibacterium sp.]|uniref:AAA family ATPase n=1 Tax=uncultured Arcticibacterium sp. TaxID=2173042 RepID=UPI0030FD13FB